MKETILFTSSTSGGGECPILEFDTGPGNPQMIACTPEDDKGFLGEVNPNELISGSDLAITLGLTIGTNQSDINTIPWLKFYLDGKILFIAKRPFKYGISWDQINTANAVYGSRIITIGNYDYKIRLMKGIRPDSEGIEWTAGYDVPITHGSEWNRLMYNILPAESGYPQDSQIGEDWVSYTPEEVNAIATGSYGILSWCQEVWAPDTSYRVLRGQRSLSRLTLATYTNVGVGLGWRPVLELVV